MNPGPLKYKWMYFQSTGCESLANGLTLGCNCWNCPLDMGLWPKSCTNGYQGAVALGSLRLTSNCKGRIYRDQLYGYKLCMSLLLVRLQDCWCSLEDSSSFPQCTSVWGVAATTGTQFVTCFVSSFVSNSELLGKNSTVIQWLNGCQASRSRQENNILLHQVLVVAHPSDAICGTWTEGDKPPTGPAESEHNQCKFLISFVYGGWRHWDCKRKCGPLLGSSDKTRSSTMTGFKPFQACSTYINSASH